MNTQNLLEFLAARNDKAAMPVVSYPALCFMPGVKVGHLAADADLQAQCVVAAAENMPSCVAFTPMDLSVEAECFGAQVRIAENEIPSVRGALLSNLSEVDSLAVPEVGGGRTRACLDTASRLCKTIIDRPIVPGVIGPFSLAGRLADVTEIMFLCYDEPLALSVLLEKCTAFIINYIAEFKKAGAHGVLLCEPLAGMLSPALEAEFSAPFVKKIADASQDGDFSIIYHNCGSGVESMADSIFSNGCSAFHFGNSVSIEALLDKAPRGVPIMGNLDPVGLLRDGSPEAVAAAVKALRKGCGSRSNFILSTGCDVPPGTPWENIMAMFD